MPELSQRASELDTRLAEIDRKLRAIQVDLDPLREPSPGRASPPEQEPRDAPPPVAPPIAQSPAPPPPAPSPDPPNAATQEQSARGRSGPLAALLQRSARRPPSPGDNPSPPPGESPPAQPAGGANMVPAEMHAKLLSAMRDLLDAYGWTLRQLPVAEQPQRAGEPPAVGLSVGPFANTAGVRAFEHELLRLPGVREVVLRGYEGEDRAMFDVQLSASNA